MLLFLLVNAPIGAQNLPDITQGTRHRIYSEALDEEREYWVSLPDGYTNPLYAYKSYPILIVLDGATLFIPITGTVDHLSALRQGTSRIPPMIVVGLLNVNRERDFTPDKIITRRENQTGGGDRFLAFLEGELIPALAENYRTTPYHILYGHSLAGLLAAHTFLKEKTTFNALLAIDPSFGTWDEATMDEKMERVTAPSFDRYLYLASANWGARNLNNRDRHVRYYNWLQRLSQDTMQARYDYFEDENHASVPLIAFYQGINAMFQGYGLRTNDVDSPKAVIDHYQKISDRLSYRFPPPEDLVVRLGSQHMRTEDWQQAIAYFELNTRNYPNSLAAHRYLARAYEADQQIQRALSTYRRILELDPGNAEATAKLRELRK